MKRNKSTQLFPALSPGSHSIQVTNILRNKLKELNYNNSPEKNKKRNKISSSQIGNGFKSLIVLESRGSFIKEKQLKGISWAKQRNASQRLSFINKSIAPGPGAYSPELKKIDSKSLHPSFGDSKRDIGAIKKLKDLTEKEKESLTPGPGSYIVSSNSIATNLNHQRKIRVFNKPTIPQYEPDKFLHGPSVGPGAYFVPSSINPSIKGSIGYSFDSSVKRFDPIIKESTRDMVTDLRVKRKISKLNNRSKILAQSDKQLKEEILLNYKSEKGELDSLRGPGHYRAVSIPSSGGSRIPTTFRGLLPPDPLRILCIIIALAHSLLYSMYKPVEELVTRHSTNSKPKQKKLLSKGAVFPVLDAYPGFLKIYVKGVNSQF